MKNYEKKKRKIEVLEGTLEGKVLLYIIDCCNDFISMYKNLGCNNVFYLTMYFCGCPIPRVCVVPKII